MDSFEYMDMRFKDKSLDAGYLQHSLYRIYRYQSCIDAYR